MLLNVGILLVSNRTISGNNPPSTSIESDPRSIYQRRCETAAKAWKERVLEIPREQSRSYDRPQALLASGRADWKHVPQNSSLNAGASRLRAKIPWLLRFSLTGTSFGEGRLETMILPVTPF